MTILKSRRGVFVALAVILSLCCVAGAYAQSGQADVQGIVTDPQGGVLVGAQVILTNTDSGDKRTVKTASDGRYTFPTIAPGHYSIMVSATSFSPATINGLTIELDNHVNQNVALKIGGANDVVQVTSDVPQVDTSSYDVGGVIRQEQINDLPIQNRQYLNLALLVPGTSQDTSRNFYNNVQAGSGTAFYTNGFYLDGVTNQQTEEGDPRQNIPEGAVAEFKVYTSSYPAQLGWAMGGFVTTVTKSGTNKIHGEAFEYYRDTAMSVPSSFTVAAGALQGTGNPTYNRNQFGFDMGGPIIKDKIHYYGAYESTLLTTSYTLFVPAALQSDYSSITGVFQEPNHDNLLTLRADADVSKNQQVFVRYAQEWNLVSGNGCGGTTTIGCYDGQIPRWAIVAGHTWEPTPRIVNEARFQYAFISYELGPWGTPPPKKPQDFSNPSYNSVGVGYSFPSISWGHTYAADGVETRWELVDSVTIQKGAHTIKLGFDDSYVPYTDATAGSPGNWTFTTDQPFNPTSAANLAGLVNARTFTQTVKPTLYFLDSTQQSYYVQDSWKAKPNLTINAGIRYDLQRGSAFLDTFTPPATNPVIPYEGNPHTRGDWNNWGPRIGVSWDPFNKDKDVFRAGYGVYYNFIETELQEAEKLNFYQCSISLATGTPPGYTLSYPNPYGGQSVSSYCSTAAPTVTIIAPNFHNAYAHQFSLGYSRQLGRDLSVSVDGLYAHSLGQAKTFDRNIPANYPTVTARPYTTFKSINQRTSTGSAEYKAVYFKIDKRMSHRYMYSASYALTSQHDNIAGPTNYYNLNEDWGPSSVDQRHAVVLSGSVMLPFKIQVGAINTFRSAEPFSTTTSVYTGAAGVFPVTAQPNINGTAQYVPGTTRGSGNRHYNYAALNTYRQNLDTEVSTYSGWSGGTTGVGTIIAGTMGCAVNSPGVGNCLSTNLNAGMIHSSRINNFDIHVSRVMFQHESMKLELIGQAFDLFGVQTGGGATGATTAAWGVATSGSTRQIGELAAKFTF